jgi:hypothetical protein
VPREDFVRKLKELEVCSEDKAGIIFDSLKGNYENYLDFNSFHHGFRYSSLLDQSKSLEHARSIEHRSAATFKPDSRRPLSQSYLIKPEREPAGKRSQQSSYLDRVQAVRLKDIEGMLDEKWRKADSHQSDAQIKYRLARGGPVIPSAKVLSVYKSYIQDRSRK